MKVDRGIKSLIYLLLLGVFLPSIQAQKIRILPLGNSITAGNICTTGDINDCQPIGGHIMVGYRHRLYNLLTGAGYDIDFVGSEKYYGTALMADPDCGGFGGMFDQQLADVMETGSSSHWSGTRCGGPYLNCYPADIILLHIGTNDVLANDVNRTEIGRILDAVDDYERANGTDIMVFVARIISTRGQPCGTYERVISYNNLIDNLVATRKAQGDLITKVDMECGAGINYSTDIADQVHPNQDGYDKMATKWFQVLSNYLGNPSATYSLTMQQPAGSGSVTPGVGTHNYAQGSTISLSASPSVGYQFDGWTGSIVSGSNPVNLTMNADKTVKANFSPVTAVYYDLTMQQPSGSGSVNPGVGTHSYAQGSSISLSATPSAGYQFDGWTGSIQSSENPISLTMDGDKSVKANFSVQATVYYDLNMVKPAGEGSVSPPVGSHSYEAGSTVILEATPEDGYEFSRWSGSIQSTENPKSLTMDATRDVKANFTLLSYQLTIGTDGTAGALVSPSGSISADHGVATNINVATIPEGYEFAGWEVISGSSVQIADPSAQSTTVTLESGDASVRATFSEVTPVYFELSMQEPEGSGSVSPEIGNHSLVAGSNVILEATPSDGYEFSSWTGSIQSGNNPASLTMDAHKNVKAIFNLKSYQLTIAADGTAGAQVSPSGTVSADHGVATDISVTTLPEGYVFAGWEVLSGSSVQIADPSAQSTTVTLESGDASVRARFSEVVPGYFELSMLEPEGSGSVSPEIGIHSMVAGSNVNLEATPSDGYEFSSWTGSIQSASNPASLTMDAHKNVKAIFDLKSYQLTIATDGTAGALVTPSGTVSADHGVATDISVTTLPEGYVFAGWEVLSGSSVQIADPSAQSTTVTLESGDASIVAKFSEILDIEIISVSIPNEPMVIGDSIQARITLSKDLGSGASLVSGKIGTYKLDGLFWMEEGIYASSMHIEAGGTDYQASDDIPVEDLVIAHSDGANVPFSHFITQDNDPIDANAPVIYSLSVPDSAYGVGEMVVLSIQADQESYLLMPGSMVNGVSGESKRLLFREMTGGEYQLLYAVDRLDQDVAEGELAASIILSDPAGNTGDTATHIEANALSISVTATGILPYTAGGILVYPNPAHDYVTLEIPGATYRNSLLRIIDMKGDYVIEKMIRSQKDLVLQIQHLSPGVYTITCTDDTGKVYIGRFVR